MKKDKLLKFLFSIEYIYLAPINGPAKIDVSPESLSGYLNNLYTLGVALCVGLAVLMIVIGGVQWASSDAWGKKQEGKDRIWSAVLGLLIALGSYMILNTINPKLLNTVLNMRPVNTSSLGERTAEERAVAQTTPQTIPQADPNYVPEFNEDGTLRVRSTYYYAGEPGSDDDTNAGKSSTGTPLRPATANQVGVAAVDPNIVPYGSMITVQTPEGPRYYIAADTGGAVKSRQASGGTAPVIDFYSNGQVGGEYTDVTIKPYNGSTPYENLSGSQKESFFNINNFR